MEPLSILGAAGSIVNVIDVAARCISSLHSLQQRWKDADMAVTFMMGQISTLKVALEQISQWMENGTDTLALHKQLLLDLDLALHSSRISITFIDDHITTLMRNQYNELTFKSKARAMAQNTTVQECAKHLNSQTVALNLLLTALNCRSLSEQKSLLLEKDNRQIMEQVKDDSSSLLCLLDSNSCRSSLSGSTDRASLWSKTFDFDGDLLRSKVYKQQFRVLMKRFSRKRAVSQETREVAAGDYDPEKQERRQRQAARDILLSGPDKGSRMQLLRSLQSVFDPARTGSIEKADKDEFIRYHLANVCVALWIANVLVDDVKIVYDERMKRILQFLGEELVDASELWPSKEIEDQLAQLALIWKDERMQALKNSELFTQRIAFLDANTIFHTLDMIADPQLLPTTQDIAEMEGLSEKLLKIPFQDWHFLDVPSSASAGIRPVYVVDVLPRVVVIDLLKMYQTKKQLNKTLLIGYRNMFLEDIGVKQYLRDDFKAFWHGGRLHLIIMTHCDDFLNESLKNIGWENPSFDKKSMVRRLIYEADRIGNARTDVHLMWRYDDDEVHRLYDAIKKLQQCNS